jgi:hypothetical protein
MLLILNVKIVGVYVSVMDVLKNIQQMVRCYT